MSFIAAKWTIDEYHPYPENIFWLVVWEEGGKYPHVILEILSESTANTDKEYKKKLYQDTFRTPDYFWFDLRLSKCCIPSLFIF